jgi:phytol kinase
VSVGANLALIVFSISVLVGVVGLVLLASRQFRIDPELKRKIVHVATGAYALTLPVTFTDRWPVMVLVGISIVVMVVMRSQRSVAYGLGSVLHSVERKSYGEIYLALAVGFLFFRSTAQPVLYVLPIAVVTLSDAAAALVGTAYGRRHFAVEHGVKSIEGVVTFFVVTWLVAMILLLLMSDVPRATVVVLGFLIAAFGALVESQSWQGLDNLFVPISIHLLLSGNLNAQPLGLAVGAIGFLALVAVLVGFAPVLRLSGHSARGFAILIFIILSYTAPYNALLPVAAIGAHGVAQFRRPCASGYPDLDLLAAIAGVGLFWLFLGEYFGHSAIDLFALTLATAAIVFIGLASEKARWLIATAALPVLVALAAVVALNARQSAWHGPLWPWAGAGLAVATAVALWRPQFFDRWRGVRVLLASSLAPAALFVIRGLLA